MATDPHREALVNASYLACRFEAFVASPAVPGEPLDVEAFARWAVRQRNERPRVLLAAGFVLMHLPHALRRRLADGLAWVAGGTHYMFAARRHLSAHDYEIVDAWYAKALLEEIEQDIRDVQADVEPRPEA